jgi:rod shape-determining protein MreC
VIINKGKKHGLEKGMPVVVPDGVVGQVSVVSESYSRVILIVDRLSSVDAIVQKSRARGIIQGKSADTCLFNYALRKHDFSIGDVVITSGNDGVYPKGLRIGSITNNLKFSSGIFQDVEITPFVDFEKLEEVLVVLKPDIGYIKNR